MKLLLIFLARIQHVRLPLRQDNIFSLASAKFLLGLSDHAVVVTSRVQVRLTITEMIKQKARVSCS